MGLLQWFRRRGEGGPVDVATHAHPGDLPGAEDAGPPVGVFDPGALSGDDADEVIAADEGDDNDVRPA
jgi:hypothetical protein